MAKLVGILNLTPDSFSDGNKYTNVDDALAAIRRMAADGATVIDIGAESTRPGAMPVSPPEEWRRLEPVLQALSQVRMANVSFSIDTRHPETAAKALELGVDWINDVTGFVSPAMIGAVRASQCKLIMMHSLGVPANRSITLPSSADVVQTLLDWGKERILRLEEAGIARNRLVFDPGIGFGKTPEQTLTILRNLDRFRLLGLPILIGHSRKSFLASMGDRDDATIALSLYLAHHGVDYLRVHDVLRHTQMISVWNSVAYDDRESAHRRTA